jgi:hypothetical protein
MLYFLFLLEPFTGRKGNEMIGLLLAIISGPQGILWTAFPEGCFTAVQCAGDVNGDGTGDIFAASLEQTGFGIHCLNGLTGEVIWSNQSSQGVYGPGCLRTVGDVNLDGIPEVAAGQAGSPRVFLLCGATGAQIWNSPQDRVVQYVEGVVGPEPGDVVVLAMKDAVSSSGGISALDGQSGQELWFNYTWSTDDAWIRVTGTDISGNGWSEMGYSIDRGYAWSGSAEVWDGYTGELISSQPTIYYGCMDICDSPVPSLAVSHFGDLPSTWVVDLPSEEPVWDSGEEYDIFATLDFIQNVTGPGEPRADLLGNGPLGIYLINGDNGFYEDAYPLSTVATDCFHDGHQWCLAALTPGTFNAPPLVFSSPVTTPQTQLPNSPGSCMCLFESDQYPTPLVAVAMEGASGPGICVIHTSWPVATGETASSPIPAQVPVGLVECPGTGFLTVQGIGGGDAVLLDAAGRVVGTVSLRPGEREAFHLPPGVYHLVDSATGMLLQRGVVLAR